MPVPAPANTYVSYNGWTFYAPRLKWSWDLQPVQNESKTYIIGTQYTLVLRAIVTNDPLGVSAGTDASHTPGDNLDDMVVALEKPGGELSVRGLGWDTDINVGGSSNDLLFGPWTQGLTVTPIGGTLTVEVLWKLTWTVGCTQMIAGIDYVDAYMEGTTSVDQYGLTTRTITGMIRAYSRFNSGVVTGDAERLWDQVVIPVPPGFRRLTRTWNVSSAQDTCRYSITDKELPSVLAPIPGTIETTFSHTLSSSGKGEGVGTTLINNFSMSARLPKGGSSMDAYNHLIHLTNLRLEKARSQGYSVLILSFSVTENDIFEGKSLSLNMSFQMNKQDINDNGGIPWQVVPDMGMFNYGIMAEYRASTGAWSDRLEDFQQLTNRGPANLTTEYQKLIFGSCTTRSGAITASQIGEIVDYALESALNAILGGCPDEANSYFYIKHHIDHQSSAGGVAARTNPPENSGPELDNYSSRLGMEDGYTYGGPGIGPVRIPNRPAEDSQVVYGSTSPLVNVWHSGVAIRIGYAPAMPDIDRQFIQEHNKGNVAEFSRWSRIIEGPTLGGCKTYMLLWRVGYHMTPEANNEVLPQKTLNFDHPWIPRPGVNE